MQAAVTCSHDVIVLILFVPQEEPWQQLTGILIKTNHPEMCHRELGTETSGWTHAGRQSHTHCLLILHGLNEWIVNISAVCVCACMHVCVWLSIALYLKNDLLLFSWHTSQANGRSRWSPFEIAAGPPRGHQLPTAVDSYPSTHVYNKSTVKIAWHDINESVHWKLIKGYRLSLELH